MTITPAMAVQRQTALSASVPNVYSFQHLRYLPPGYDADPSVRWPLMIFLHGAGERGTDVERVAVNGPPRLIEQGRDFPCIVVSPLCSGSGWVAAGLHAFIKDLVQQYRVDPNRVYLTGLSMGGYGTWDLAVHYPDFYAAAVPLCGGGDPGLANRLRNMPVWAFHGKLDATVAVTQTLQMIDAIKAAGGAPKLTIYDSLGHDVWSTTYANDEVYTWLFGQNLVRAPAPPAIGTQPKSAIIQSGGGMSFFVLAAGIPVPLIQWQRQPAGSALWENLAEGGSYRGVRTDTLTISATAAGMAGDKFRALLSNASGSVTTEVATLTVNGANLLQFPAGLAIDNSGNLYVADSSSNTLRKVTPAGVVSTLAGTVGTAGSADGTGAAARFNQPSAIALDRDGNLVVADTGNATIRRITPEGVVTTLAGSAVSRGSSDGAGGSATFNAPAGIAADAAGNLYVADTFNATIRKITSTGTVSTVAGSAGNRGTQDGVGAAARFNYPNGLCLDAAGNLYVADTYNSAIRKIASDGTVSTLAGLTGVGGATDGQGSAAQFNQPAGIVAGAGGILYVADTGNSTVRKVTTAGAVTTFAGLWGVAGLSNGVGDAAFFNQPRSLVVDAAGNIFVADTGNAAIRKIASDATVTTMALSEASTLPPVTTPAPSTSGGISNPTPSPSASSSSGGGAIECWFAGALALLGLARRIRRA